VQLPEQGEIPYEELFYRKSDKVTLQAKTVELADICYFNTRVSLGPVELRIGDLILNPETVTRMEVVADELSLPREAMGFGDVKFMAAIGAFLGWKAVIFSLMISSMIGAAVGLTLIVLKKQEWSSRLPYGPYIALAATIWMFAGPQIVSLLFPMP
jgi:leader peptidase (prepilin peptidase)/N-methyltransferase